MGHQFGLREGHWKDMEQFANQERSPIFLQFVDCVAQILRKFPSYFEFCENLLVVILDHFHSCTFGSFLSNSELGRKMLECKDKTLSIWDFVGYHCKAFKNQRYNSNSPKIIQCDFSPDNFEVKLWEAYYLRWQFYRYPTIKDGNFLYNVMSLNFIYQTEKQLFPDRKRALSALDNVSELQKRVPSKSLSTKSTDRNSFT